jgi:predicted SnoaL-like aldol condensation-catalyzing enzyme
LFNGPSENLWEYCNPGGPALVLEAFDTLFDKRDYATAEKFWSEDYVQHSSRIPPGRDGLFEVIKSRPPEFAYEPELIMAENDLVMIWGRFSGHGAGLPWIVVNIIRIEDGLLKEHWGVSKTRSLAPTRWAVYRCSVTHFRRNAEVSADRG